MQVLQLFTKILGETCLPMMNLVIIMQGVFPRMWVVNGRILFESYNDGIRKVALRISIVLGKNGGAFPVMCRFVKLGLGGKQGPGTQWVSWLHIDDWVSIVRYIILNDLLTGPINLAAPNPTTNSTLMNELRSHYAPFNFGFRHQVGQSN